MAVSWGKLAGGMAVSWGKLAGGTAVSWGKLAGGMAVSWGKLAGGKLAYNYSSSCPAASHLAVCVATKHVA